MGSLACRVCELVDTNQEEKRKATLVKAPSPLRFVRSKLLGWSDPQQLHEISSSADKLHHNRTRKRRY